MKDSVFSSSSSTSSSAFFLYYFFLLSAKIEYKRQCQNQNDIRGENREKREKKETEKKGVGIYTLPSSKVASHAHTDHITDCIHHYISGG